MDDDLDALSWAAHLPEQDRARLREELESWRATAEAYRDGHGETLSTPVDLTDDELPAEVLARVEASRAAGPGRSGRPVRREHMDAVREALVAGEESGPAAPFDFDTFVAAKKAPAAEGDGTEPADGEPDWSTAQEAVDEMVADIGGVPDDARAWARASLARAYRHRGGYGSSSKQVSDLGTPPSGPAPGAVGDGTDDA